MFTLLVKILNMKFKHLFIHELSTILNSTDTSFILQKEMSFNYFFD